MRRVGISLLVLIALVAMAGPASAQPKVTITGFVDNVMSWDKNMSNADINPARSNDREWYSRTRVRPDITAEVGTTKFVLGLEIDAAWGQVSAQDTNVCLNAACPAQPGVQQRGGSNGGWDLNTDTPGIIEIKWAYTEFDIPIIPVPTRMRVGAQPWEATYKLATLANGDFAGAHLTMQLAPMAKWNFTFAQIEESSTGPTDNFIRGDDFAIVTSVEITPFKGLDIRPIFSYANFIGPTGAAARTGRGGVGTGAANFQVCPGTAGPGTGNCLTADNSSAIENRYTIGVDARWRFGAFSFDPTVFYQFGRRDQTVAFSPFTGATNTLDRSAWLVDLRGGWQAGPLLLEAAAIYTTGNHAKDRIDRNSNVTIKYYEPISTDTSYFATWAEIWALGIDYFNIIRSNAPGVNPGVAIGYDKYGLIRIGTRASYALTPAFTLRAAVSAQWTAQEVDTTNSVLTAANGLGLCVIGTPGGPTGPASAQQCDRVVAQKDGDSRFLGTEVNLGFQWRFVPNVALDVVGSYMFAGNALTTHLTANSNTGILTNGRNPQDIMAVTARVRYSW